MAVPGQITLNSLTPGPSSLEANFTNPTPGDTDRVYFQIKQTGDIEWITADIPGGSPVDAWGLEPSTSYDVRLRAVNDIDGFGPWSNTLTQTTSADSMAPALVLWDEDSVVGSGPGTQLVAVNNVNGSLGSPYNLTTLFGTTSALTEQVRNGRPVWQRGGGGDAGISTNPTPPSPAINQPCTIYVALTPFFVDANARWIIRGGFANIEVRVRNDGFILSSNGNGIYAVGSPQTDGRVYVLECQVNNTNSKLRVLDDQGNDSGEQTGNIQYAGPVSPEVMAWDVGQQGNASLPAQFMEVGVYPGLGTVSERQARREELFQKWAFDAPDLIEYTTGDSANTLADTGGNGAGAVVEVGDVDQILDDVTPTASGTLALMGGGASQLDDVTPTTAGSVELGGGSTATLAPVAASASGTVETPPPPPIVPPQSPNFQRMYEHLLPTGEAFE